SLTCDSKQNDMDGHESRNAHLVGVCGSGMKALAELLLEQGWTLSGSDQSPPNRSIQRLISQGLRFHQGHRAAQLPDACDLLVHSPAVPVDNPERKAARSRGIVERTYSQMVGQLMSGLPTVCIAGTHGKSTTTAMTASILEAAGQLSAAVVGAELRET